MDPTSLTIGTVLAVGIGLATLIVRSTSRLDRRIDRVELIQGELRREVGELRERMAKLEGLLEGLREAVSGRRAA